MNNPGCFVPAAGAAVVSRLHADVSRARHMYVARQGAIVRDTSTALAGMRRRDRATIDALCVEAVHQLDAASLNYKIGVEDIDDLAHDRRRSLSVSNHDRSLASRAITEFDGHYSRVGSKLTFATRLDQRRALPAALNRQARATAAFTLT